ncbi:uncharacterized protein RHIMIDRAFT_75957 [Rhizopus microsporus ATCC 52813]|uniref:FAD-binding FR-type domain-containing protein n=1 Tax=Rhizopus microsporus ATCC 52813 TaxID=1340429 RepID=A0A2G4SJ49_RHIZD|nr:uncharacterized protein RHIMIDRAFT_75957 [Rhizopus microsporus ATCC 52813]PHZ08426.1 hypothetical protein RHIMIDRAFT_75957 [Rhizopus microsporus ATCC 52813]
MSRKSILIYFISGLFILAIFAQLNSYLALITLPNSHSKDDTAIQERYQREYKALIVYIICLSATCFILLLQSWLKQSHYNQQKLLGHPLTAKTATNRYNSWLQYEWRWFSTTLSLSFIIKLGTLIGVNIMLILISNDEDKHLMLQGRANRAAQLAVANTAAAVALSAKLSIIQRYFYGVEKTLSWHPWFGRIALVETLYHGAYQFQLNYARQNYDLILALTTNIRYMTGASLISAMIILVIGSHPLVRHISYRLFRLTHIGSFLVLILLGCLHHWVFYVFYAAVLGFWIIDQVDRSFEIEVCSLQAMPGNIVKIQATVPYTILSPIPGQFAFLSFSSSWIHAWIHSHPFSICRIDTVNGKDQDDDSEGIVHQALTFYIKVSGKRTLSLYQKAVDQEKVKMRISRPLGRPYLTIAGSEFGDFKTIVLVADGVGLAPWISVLQYVSEKKETIKTRSVYLIWSIHAIGRIHRGYKEYRLIFYRHILCI